MKIAFMFPGQGAQISGMGKDFYDTYEEARDVYDKASDILGIDMKKLCFELPIEELSKTENTQIAIATTSLAILAVLQKRGIKAEISVGLSLGEYVALMYAGYLTMEEGLLLLKQRGYLMGHFVPEEEFAMTAIIGSNAKLIESVCQKVNDEGKFVTIANYNYSSQTVISGSLDGIEQVEKELKDQGVAKMIRLKTSGPFHTIKLKKASDMYQDELKKVGFHKEQVITNVIKNLDGTFYKEEDDMVEILSRHIISSVRFDKAIQKMKEEEIDTFVEVGPGKALSGFVKKELPEANVFSLSDVSKMQEFLDQVEEEK